MSKRTALVIGAGIVGLATARALARKNFSVKLLDRSLRACGASVRNFGMVWPIGQPAGKQYEYAIASRNAWETICKEANIWYNRAGSLHLAYNETEWKVLQELFEIYKNDRPWKLLDANAVAAYTQAARTENLLGGLYSSDELIVDPREAIAQLPDYLTEKYGIEFIWNKCASYIADETAYVGLKEEYRADLIFICNGTDFETLYPELFAGIPITKCKLQMMRFRSQSGQEIGTSLCGGLSLIHYNSFAAAPGLQELKRKYQAELPAYLQWGIHVMVSQNGKGELTVGDSHEYGSSPDPFDKNFINQMILDYLQKFAVNDDWQLLETWNGVYAKMTDGQSHYFTSPEPGVYILNALGGAGMTLSFGLAEQLVNNVVV